MNGDAPQLRFLAEILHPAVRLDNFVVQQLQAFYNEVLLHDGYKIVQVQEWPAAGRTVV